MKFLNTPHKKKSAGLTALVAVLLLFLFFVLGLTYYDPPISYGMEVNFGTLAQGSGNIQPQQPVSSKPTPVQNEPKVEQIKPQPTPKITTPEKTPPVLTEKESEVSVPKKDVSTKESQPPVEEEKVKEDNEEKLLIDKLYENRWFIKHSDVQKRTDLDAKISSQFGQLLDELQSFYYHNHGHFSINWAAPA